MTIVKVQINLRRIINLFYGSLGSGLVFTPRDLLSLFSEADSCFKRKSTTNPSYETKLTSS